MKSVLQLTVLDRPGVLDRVVGLIRRRNWNIDSMTVGDLGEGLSLMTFLLEGRGLDMQALGEHLEDMDAVQAWRVGGEDGGVMRELLLFQVPEADAALAGKDGVRVLARAGGTLVCEYTDAPSRVDAFVQQLRALHLPCARSGPLSLPNQADKEASDG